MGNSSKLPKVTAPTVTSARSIKTVRNASNGRIAATASIAGIGAALLAATSAVLTGRMTTKIARLA